MTHIEYDDFGEYTETIDLIPAGAQVHCKERREVLKL